MCFKTKFVLSAAILFLLAAFSVLSPATGSAQCVPSCYTDYFCSSTSCCQCLYGNNASAYGPVKCCPPPGGTNCSTYNVSGCNPAPTNTPATPTPTLKPSATPIPTATPTPNPNAKRLPSTTFSYGSNCDIYKGGCPLTSFTQADSTTQSRTANDFFLREVDNGYNGKVRFEYWGDATNTNAINIEYCDQDKTSATGVIGCRTDNKYNTQRHRISKTITNDGMGNEYASALIYPSALPRAYVKTYADNYRIDICPCDTAEKAVIWCDNPLLRYDNVCGPDCDMVKQSTIGCCNYGYYDRYLCTSTLAICGAEDGKTNTMCLCNCEDDWVNVDFSGYEFLGYPYVESIGYEKNSTQIAGKTKTFYYTALDTATCFKPSPLKGVAHTTYLYDADNLSRYSENTSKYKVRLGPMADTGYTEVKDSDLNSQCANYDPEETVTTVLKTDHLSKNYMPYPQLCTRSSTTYDTGRYALPLETVDWGKVSCSDYTKDDTSDTPRKNTITYTNANTTAWILPLVAETYSSNPASTDKYNHTRNYYDYAYVMGTIGSTGLLTRTQKLIDSSVVSETALEYDSSYPWQIRRITDPLGNATQTAYDTKFRMFPVSVTNSIGQTEYITYDFNETDTSHPNYGQVRGVITKTTDANDAVSTNVYDSFGRLTETYLPGKSSGSDMNSIHKKYYYFNESDGLSICNADTNCLTGLGKAVDGKPSPKMMVWDGSRMSDEGTIGIIGGTHTYYNGIGQIVQKRNVWYEGEFTNAGISLDEGKKDFILPFKYNALGKEEYVYDSYTAIPHTLLSKTSYDFSDPETNGTGKISYLYDGFGRQVQINYPDLSIEKNVFDLNGNPLETKSLDRNCNDGRAETPCSEKSILSDAFGQVAETKILDVSSGTTYKTTGKYHSVLGLPTEIYDTRGNLINKIEYDKLGRKTKMWNVDMSPSMLGDENAWRYSYDALGNLVSQTDPKGTVTTSVYDNLSRLKSGTVNGVKLVENSYDLCLNGKGRLCKSESYDLTSGKLLQTMGYEYDVRGRMVKRSETLSNMPDSAINGKAFVTETTYDEGGRVLTSKLNGVVLDEEVSIPSETLSTNYNTSEMSGVATDESIGRYFYDNIFNKDGQAVSFFLGNGVKVSNTFDNLNKRLKTKNVSGSNILPQDVISISYNYDPSGNIVSISDLNTSKEEDFQLNQAFVYDAFYRLKNVTGSYNASYEYDDVNNITSIYEGQNATSLTYSDLSGGYYHRPESADIASKSASFAYDSLGNMISDGRNTYTYDANNRLVKTITTGVVVTPTDTPAVTPSISPTPTPYRIPGDADNNGVVDEDDYAIWLANYYTSTNKGSDAGDFNGDTFVDGIDYALWLKNFGIVPTPTTAPIPTATPTPKDIPTIESCTCKAGSVVVNNCGSLYPVCTSKSVCKCMDASDN